MLRLFPVRLLLLSIVAATRAADQPDVFAGRIVAEFGTGSSLTTLQYTVSAKHLRIELPAAGPAEPVDIFDLQSNAVTLLFAHNLSFTRLPPSPPTSPAATPPVMPGVPPGIGAPAGIGPRSLDPGAGKLPSLPPIPNVPPILPGGSSELVVTNETKVILGIECRRYELKQPTETLEIWATDKLIPFQAYVRGAPPKFGPRLIDDLWPAMMQERKLFPLLVSLRYPNGTERFRFEVKSITPERIVDADGTLFQPPPDYQELPKLPF